MRSPNDDTIADDVRTLQRLGYRQELARRLSGFSNYALSLSIICILSGCLTSFHLGFCSVGGAAIGIGWPVVCLFSLVVALTMGQVASAFPTAGGLYHWATILGGRGWGWGTAWFNLVGWITVLAAVNVGTFKFIAGSFFPERVISLQTQLAGVAFITLSQAFVNHLGIRVTSIITDFSGYWILAVAALLAGAFLWHAPALEPERLVTLTNFSGLPGHDPVWPANSSLLGLFALGFMLPVYTISGFDAAAHASEETIGAGRHVPQSIVRSVWVSATAGWILLAAIVLAIPDMHEAARQGENVFFWTATAVLPDSLRLILSGGVGVAQYVCGLATLTAASRMTFAFARDGGLPASAWLRKVHPERKTPVPAIWTVAVAAILFTVYTPAYATITVVCTIFLYISYVLPTGLGMLAHGRSWTVMGPWHIGRWYRPLAALSVVGCGGLIVIGMQPPHDEAIYVVAGAVVLLMTAWFLRVRHTFPGPRLPAGPAKDASMACEKVGGTP